MPKIRRLITDKWSRGGSRLTPWAAPEWADDPAFVLTAHVTTTRLPALGDQATLRQAGRRGASIARGLGASLRAS